VSDAASGAPKRRAKKKRRRQGPATESERPPFAHDFPRDAALDALLTAFEQGNYAHVREHAKKLSRSTRDAEVRRAADALLRRIEPAPVAVYLIALAAVLLCFFSLWYWTHPHP
jgi:hypothetical protein